MRWRGKRLGHILNPKTGWPVLGAPNSVTVVAGHGWAAEVLAKAVLLRGSNHPYDLVDGGALELIHHGERITVTPGTPLTRPIPPAPKFPTGSPSSMRQDQRR